MQKYKSMKGKKYEPPIIKEYEYTYHYEEKRNLTRTECKFVRDLALTAVRIFLFGGPG